MKYERDQVTPNIIILNLGWILESSVHCALINKFKRNLLIRNNKTLFVSETCSSASQIVLIFN